MPCLRPLWGRDANAVVRRDVAFRTLNNVGSHKASLSGLNHTACILPVYASCQGLPRCHATLGSGCRHTCRTGLVTRRVPMKSSEIYTISFQFPGFAWRTQGLPPCFARSVLKFQNAVLPRCHLHVRLGNCIISHA